MADATIVGYRPEAMDHVAAFLAGNSKSLPERVLQPGKQRGEQQLAEVADAVGEADEADHGRVLPHTRSRRGR